MHATPSISRSPEVVPPVDTVRRGMKRTDFIESKGTAALWDTRDLASFIGCSERQVARLRDEGLPFIRVGVLVRFVPSRVMAWLDSRDERARQLADIAASGDEDKAECAAADLFREFPPAP